jgi:hypothetical protein
MLDCGEYYTASNLRRICMTRIFGNDPVDLADRNVGFFPPHRVHTYWRPKNGIGLTEERYGHVVDYRRARNEIIRRRCHRIFVAREGNLRD